MASLLPNGVLFHRLELVQLLHDFTVVQRFFDSVPSEWTPAISR